jgi:cytochrome b561
MILRLINRLAVGALSADPDIESWQKAVSSVVHTSLYVLLLDMPIVGYTANAAYGSPTPFFELFDLAPLVGKNEALATFAQRSPTNWATSLKWCPGAGSRISVTVSVGAKLLR